MFIDLPVTVAFDCQELDQRGIAQAVKRTITLRYDTEDMTALAHYTNHYPPRSNATWEIDAAGLFFGLLSENDDRRIRERAARHPVDYCADANEGEVRQEEVDRQRQDNSQFGVGA